MAAVITDAYFSVGKLNTRDKCLSSREQEKSSFAICVFMEKIPYYKNHFDIPAELLNVHYTFSNVQSQFFVPETTGGMIFKN